MILGVTGGIATGKSSIVRIFQDLGALVVSADELAREAVAPGSHALRELTERFGTAILLPDGTLDRKALGEIIFSDAQARSDLNKITHPAIAALSIARLRELSQSNRLVVYESPLLYEAGAEGRVDRVLVVTADESTQLKRLMNRDGITEFAARNRIAAQMPLAEKVRRADYVIDNSGPLGRTENQVRILFRKLSAMASPPR